MCSSDLPDDLADLIKRQIDSWDRVAGRTFNVGGGRRGSVSLREFTALCREATGREVPIEADDVTAAVDVPWYITDHAAVTAALGWSPAREPRTIVREIAEWISRNEQVLAKLIA